MDSFISRDLENYIQNHSSGESEVLQELRKIASEELNMPDMICGPQVARFLQMLIKLGNCRRILEVGSFIGYSAVAMAEAMSEGKLITLELEAKYAAISAPFFSRPEFSSKIEQRMGPAAKSINRLNGKFDLIFIDADKISYPEYYHKTFPLLSDNGLMIFDNMLWRGEVVRPESEEAEVISQLNKTIHNDERVSCLMLPVRDGLMMVMKR
jgi:caffeoyl-CoA O-methyltransferase